MKILLVQPAKAPGSLLGDDYFLFEPLGLEYVAAGVNRNHDVRLIDLRIEPDLTRALADFGPDIVGVTAYTVHVNPALAICREVKALDTRILTVVGGHHATVRPEDFALPEVDAVVAGEGVDILRALVERHELGRPLDGIPGLFLVRERRLVGSPAPPTADIDGCPLPDRSLSAPYRERYFSEWMRPLATIRTSKGCPFRCNFCALWRLTDGRYLKRSPEAVAEELAGIAEPNVFFADDESMVNVAGLDRLADLIAQAGIRKRFFFYGRSDTILKHTDLLEKWRDIGLARVFVGLEAFRDADLAAVNKRTTINDNERALRVLDDLGLEAYANFLVRQDFSREDFRAFRRYCRGLPLGFAGFSVLTPLPGTEFFADRQADLITRNWDHFDLIHTVLPTRLPLEEFYAEYADLIEGAVAPRRAFAFLRRFPLRELPQLILRSRRLLSQIRGAYRDHDGAAG